MSTSKATIDHLLDQLDNEAVRARKMFGEYALYRGDVVVALVCDDTLFVKDTPSGRVTIERAMPVLTSPPYPGAKPHLRIEPDAWDDRDWLRQVIAATADALPAPRPKVPAKAKRPK